MTVNSGVVDIDDQQIVPVQPRAQGSRGFELRAAVSLAHLLRAQQRQDEARNLLRPIYSWFTEGFDTADLKQAKALLDDLT